MKGYLVCFGAAFCAYCIAFLTSFTCCDEASERERRRAKRWAVTWTLTFLLLAGVGSVMLTIDEKTELDSITHSH